MIDYSTKQEGDGSADLLNSWQVAGLRLITTVGKKVLDIGCGSGSFLIHVKPEAVAVLGIDPNPHNIEVLKQHGIPCRTGYVQDFASELESQFDVVTCFEVIEHLYDPWELFEGAYGALVLGGLFTATTPNAFHLLRGLDFLFRQRHRDVLMDPSRSDTPEHIRLWSASMLVRALQKASFSNVQCYGVVRLYNRVIILKQSILVRLFAQHLICIGKK